MDKNIITEDLLYLREISKIQDTLLRLLKQIDGIIKNLPDDRDYNDLIKLINEVKIYISSTYEYIINQINSVEKIDKKLENDLNIIINKIDILFNALKKTNILDNNISEHTEKVNNIYNGLCIEDNTLILYLQELLELKNDIYKIINNLEVKFGDKKITWDDIQLIAEMARRSNKRNEFWDIRKKSFAWIIGILFTSLIFMDKLNKAITIIINWF